MSFLHGISWDALFGIAGLIAGSLMFAELSGWTKRTIENWGDLGKTHYGGDYYDRSPQDQ